MISRVQPLGNFKLSQYGNKSQALFPWYDNNNISEKIKF